MALTENEKRSDRKEKPLTKVVIRRLPPTMTQEQFLNQVSPVPEHNYIYHVKGDMSLCENAFSRAYINFLCPEDVYSFKERFDNYVFVDGKGHEYPAVVEFAPFQKIPKKRGKSRMDPKCNSVESDSYYLEFVANLNKPIEQDAKPEYTLQLTEKNDEKDTTTPLLEYIKNKRAQRLKIREVRREEREKRKKEFERKKEYGKYHEGRKYEEKSPTKSYGTKPHTPKSPKNETANENAQTETSNEKLEKLPKEKTWSEPRNKEKKFEERRERKEIKPRFPKKEYVTDNRDYKREDYSHREFRSKHYDEYKREDSKTYPKKVKKYSEKREERKIEAQKAEQRKLEQQANESKEVLTNTAENSIKVEKENLENLSFETSQSTKHFVKEEKETSNTKFKESCEETKTVQKHPLEKETEKEDQKKDSEEKNESNSSKRIRNKDRPTIPLYRPGMLSKKKQNETDDNSKAEIKTEPKKE